MCLPKCGRVDGVRSYKIPRKFKADIIVGPVERTSDLYGSTCCLTNPVLSWLESDGANESVDSCPNNNNSGNNSESQFLTCDKQTFARREKSRIAAKLRRQKENQALVKLRLTLPIQSYKAPEIPSRKVTPYRTRLCSPDSSVSSIDSCTLHAVLTYRMANSTLSRQQQLQQQQQFAAPEFEKAVTVRLAGCALRLFNWLYPHNPVGGTRSPHPDTEKIVLDGRGSEETGFPTAELSLLSQSLVVVIVDSVENTVVFASPSYCRLLGLPWSSAVGLHLSELPARQSALLTNFAQSAPVLKNRSSKTAVSPDSRSPSPPSFTSPISRFPMDTSAVSPSSDALQSLSALSHWPNQPVSAFDGPSHCNLNTWPVAPQNQNVYLSTLLPPRYSHFMESIDDIDRPPDRSLVGSPNPKPAGCKSNLFSICWSNQSPLAHRDSLSGVSSCLQAKSNLRVYLLNPLILYACASPELEITEPPTSTSTEPTVPLMCAVDCAYDHALCGSYTDLITSPRTYHIFGDLRFVDAETLFLSTVGQTQSELSSGSTLWDFIHPDDLVTVTHALAAVTDTQPVLTALHRLRCSSGGYRWSRFLAFHTERSVTSLWPEFGSNIFGTDLNRRTTDPPGDPYFYKSSPLRNYDCSSTYTSSIADRSNATTSYPNGSTMKLRVLVCCHQFSHFSHDPASLVKFGQSQTASCRSLDSKSNEWTHTDAGNRYDGSSPTTRLLEMSTSDPMKKNCRYFSSRVSPSPLNKLLESDSSDSTTVSPWLTTVPYLSTFGEQETCDVNHLNRSAEPFDATTRTWTDVESSPSTHHKLGPIDRYHGTMSYVHHTKWGPYSPSLTQPQVTLANEFSESADKYVTDQHLSTHKPDWSNTATKADLFGWEASVSSHQYLSTPGTGFSRSTSTDTGISTRVSTSDLSRSNSTAPMDETDSEVSDPFLLRLNSSLSSFPGSSTSTRSCCGSSILQPDVSGQLLPQAEIFPVQVDPISSNTQCGTLPRSMVSHEPSDAIQSWGSDLDLAQSKLWPDPHIRSTACFPSTFSKFDLTGHSLGLGSFFPQPPGLNNRVHRGPSRSVNTLDAL